MVGFNLDVERDIEKGLEGLDEGDGMETAVIGLAEGMTGVGGCWTKLWYGGTMTCVQSWVVSR